MSPRHTSFAFDLPMASPAILGREFKDERGINVGTATLAALIGAEGLGNPISAGHLDCAIPRSYCEGAFPPRCSRCSSSGFDLLDRVLSARPPAGREPAEGLTTRKLHARA